MFDADGVPVKARRVNVERLLIIGARKPNLRSALRGTRANRPGKRFWMRY
jgi:hypothetical protein